MTTKDSQNDSAQGFLAQAPRSKRLVTFTTGDHVFRVDKERLVIGSVGSADIRLTGMGVAPLHAVIELQGSESTIFDLASESGVFVNGTKIVTQKIKSGDEITIGYHKLKFALKDLDTVPTRPRSEVLNPDEDFTPLMLTEERGVEQIFDYRPAQSKRAVEVVMSWHGTILDVGHFVEEDEITLGTKRDCDFGIPATLSSSRFSLVTLTGGNYNIHLDPQMKGVLQSQGSLRSLGKSTAAEYTFQKDDFAKIAIGELDFYVSFTAAPPSLKRTRWIQSDPFFFKVFISSLLFSGLIILALLNAKAPQSLDAEQLPERLATILYQPEKYSYTPPHQAQAEPVAPTPPAPKETVTPKPQATTKIDLQPNPSNIAKPIPKEMQVGKQAKGSKAKNQKAASKHQQSQAKEGQGARAKGNEGTRGAKNAAPGKDHQTAAMRQSPNGGTGRGGGESQANDIGNVDLMKGVDSKIENILGNTAAHLGKSGEKLKGFGGFTTQGNGGLALSGAGAGGGGTAETTLGGLGTKGNGGGKIGTGMGAAGSGSAIIGGSTRVAIQSGGPEETVVSGSIDPGIIEAAILAHRDEFRLCYEREINAETPGASGRVGTTFVIGSSGAVTEAGVASTSLHNPNTERCILTVLKRIHFPIPKGAGVVQVSYPFKFHAVK